MINEQILLGVVYIFSFNDLFDIMQVSNVKN